MISFDQENQRFNYRIVGVALHDNRVFLHRAESEEFWTFPGGRGELGETAEQTLIREMCEELGTEIEVVRLLWFVENFFAYDNHDYHEIALYFLMQFPTDSPYLRQPGPFYGNEGTIKLIFQWFPQQVEALTSLPLLPEFLPAALQALPTSIQHIVHRNS
jgi:8-oxo-dGTP pyrophosphatase MutT (NUDIX family)